MKKQFLLLPALSLFLTGQIIQAQCPEGALNLASIQSGKKVLISDVSSDDDHYKKRKDYIGKTVVLASMAKLDDECWYEGSFDNDGLYEWFDYFRLSPATGENYSTEIVADDAPALISPATFDQTMINTLMSEIYVAYIDSFKSVRGKYGGFYEGYETTLQFPGAIYSGLDGISGDKGFNAHVGEYKDLEKGFMAYQNLISALRAAPIYPSLYSEERYFLLFGDKDVMDTAVNVYTTVAFLMKGTDAWDRTFADETVQVEVILMYNAFRKVYDLTFDFYDKTKKY